MRSIHNIEEKIVIIPVINKESFAGDRLSKSQIHSNHRSGSSKKVNKKEEICGVCLRLCSFLNRTQDLSIDDAKKILDRDGKYAEELSAVMCMDCPTNTIYVNKIQDGICTNCSRSNFYRICCVGHQQFKNGVLMIRNDALGSSEKELFYKDKSYDSWHLVYYDKKKKKIKRKI